VHRQPQNTGSAASCSATGNMNARLATEVTPSASTSNPASQQWTQAHLDTGGQLLTCQQVTLKARKTGVPECPQDSDASDTAARGEHSL
jgi:hypothetical protein